MMRQACYPRMLGLTEVLFRRHGISMPLIENFGEGGMVINVSDDAPFQEICSFGWIVLTNPTFPLFHSMVGPINTSCAMQQSKAVCDSNEEE
jgi:hypothetical protein